MINWIRNTSILCYALIVEINLTCCINCHVLKKSVTSDCVVDIWLRLLIKSDNLCITSTLEVEDTVVIPTVLIITDQKSLRICRKCCLTCT